VFNFSAYIFFTNESNKKYTQDLGLNLKGPYTGIYDADAAKVSVFM